MLISWLLDLIFSNLWLLLLVFWLFRSFARGARKGMEEDPASTRETVPADFPWEREQEPVIRRRPVDPIEASPAIVSPMVPVAGEGDREAPARAYRKDKKAVPALAQDESRLPPAVQGMIWSQIYGPPRSKAPHRMGRKK